MGWQYEFVSLTSDEKRARRDVLDWYGFIAHCSALAPVIVVGLIHLARLVYRYMTGTLRGLGGQGTYAEIPNSPAVKAQGSTTTGVLRTRWSQFQWWMGDEIRFCSMSWGRRADWILGLVWTLWLLFLCLFQTGTGIDVRLTCHDRTFFG